MLAQEMIACTSLSRTTQGLCSRYHPIPIVKLITQPMTSARCLDQMSAATRTIQIEISCV